jgi:ElaB/YqjD/DUF883 family membrane-anchored ribosome-binding protein
MILDAGFPLDLSSSSPLLGQIAETEEVAVIFSSPQFFVALIAGVLMAFAFQFLLTNLSVAAKISDSDDVIDVDEDKEENWGKKVRKIEGKIGAWTLITVNIALFIACFLAVKLSLTNSMILGGIIGVVIWSAYFLLLIWVSSNAVGSVIGSAVKTATSGMQGVMATAAAAIGANTVNSQIVNTVEASVAAARKELTSGLDASSLRESLEDYLGELQLPKFDLKEIRRNFETLLKDPEIQSLAGSDVLKNINRQTFVDLVSDRTDLSKQDLAQIVNQLESVWRQVTSNQKDPQADLVSYLKSAAPEELKTGDLTTKLAGVLGNGQEKQQYKNGGTNRLLQVGATALMGAVLERVDLSDVDVEKISSQLQKLGGKVKENLPSLPQFNPILADVENYILNSQPWHLNRETIKQEFRDVIYDVEAAPGAVKRQLETLNRNVFVQLLKQRGDFDENRVGEIADQLEEIRTEVFNTVQTAASQEQSQDIRSRIENYLRSTGKEELNPEGIEQDFKTLLEDPEIGYEQLRDRLSQFDRDTLVQLLGQRQDFSPEEADQLIGQIESMRDRILAQAQEKAQEFVGRIEAYLRDTNQEELNPEGIKRDLQTLFDDPQTGLGLIRERLSHFDRDTLVQLLTARGDLSEEQINRVVDQIGTILHSPQALVGKAKEQYNQLVNQIGDYLRSTKLEELDPEGIKRDFGKLFDNPQAGAIALRERLSQVDRETLVKLLSQREDLTEDQVNQIIDNVQESIRSIVKAPRRFASRTKDRVQDFAANLETYLRNTGKEELNPEGIQRDLQLLLNDPKAGVGSLSDRIQHFDRSTLVALLSQREDISEEEANRIADQVISVRDQLVEQIQTVQTKIQSAIDSIFVRIRTYLDSLDRPELNYEGIKRDFRKLFEDPQAGFDALKDRLSQFDRDTLVAILSSREDISTADANRIIDQIESARNSVLHRAERLQTEAKQRIKQIKHQAKQQAEETRKAAATAAWWLFGTAFTSVAISALAGAIAVGGFNFFG